MRDRNRRKNGNRPPDQKMLRRTLLLMTVCGIVAFAVLIFRLFQLQILEHDRYESAAIEQQLRETAVDSGRGSILDRNGRVLAMSATAETIYISPAEIRMYGEDAELIAENLSRILGVDKAKILAMSQDGNSWYKTVARKVEQDTADQVRQFKNNYQLKGVKIETDSKRYYPYGSLASHVIGFVGYDNTGLTGLEMSRNGLLAGSAGRIVRAKNAYGTDMLYTKYEDYFDAAEGNSIVTTIDSTVQFYLEKHLRQAIEDYGVRNGGAAIAMDVNTGEILGMVSMDNFDLNRYQDVSDEAQAQIDAAETEEEKSALLKAAQETQWRNKAVEEMYEPGSTFKPITVAMALEEGVISEQSSFYCSGYIEVTGDSKGHGRHCWKTAGHGAQTLTQCLQHSCNVAMIRIAGLVGAETFYKYVDAFGFNDKTGIELSGEAGSLWWDSSVFCDPLNQTQLAAASFGQTFNITPLQLVRAMSAVVNGGYLMQPYLVKQVLDGEGNVISETQPQVLRQVISGETSAIMRSMLEQVVCDKTEGTGKNAYVAGYRIGGKTGTSTDTVEEAKTGKKEYIVSFIGVAPMDDPQICILALLDSPDESCGVYVSGGNMGAPTVGKMMADILPCLGVEPEYTAEELDLMDRSVPELAGLTTVEAERTLKAQGLSCRVIGSGERVTLQIPDADSTVAAGSRILLYADSEPSEASGIMPDLTGMSYEAARSELESLALYLCTDYNINLDSDTVTVFYQSIPAGKPVELGTVVEVKLTDSDTSTYGRY